jgi:hypothetical protein
VLLLLLPVLLLPVLLPVHLRKVCACYGAASVKALKAAPRGKMLEMLLVAWRRYEAALARAPLRTKATTGAAIMALSDCVAQALQRRRRRQRGEDAAAAPWDVPRTASLALLGLLWSGPSVHLWQDWLARAVFPGQPATLALACKKTACDQAFYGPASNVVLMVYVSCVVNGVPLGEALGASLRRLPTVQLRALRFWPLVSLSSYALVAPDNRALYANVASLLWSTYLNLQL